MKVEMYDITNIKPYQNNPRKNGKAVAAVARSIEEFGFRQPIVITRDGVIVVGHTRYLAAIELNLSSVPVHFADDLSEDQIRAYRIADNRLNEIAEWDLDLLPGEIKALEAAAYDLDVIGFDETELQELLEQDVAGGLCDPDDIPEPPDAAVTQVGDIYELGPHRLMCGDSADESDVDLLIDGRPIHLAVTDPPYNVAVEPRSNNAIAAGVSSFTGATHHQKFDSARRSGSTRSTHRKLRAKDRKLANDFLSDEQFEALLDAWFANIARALEPGRSFFLWGGYANCANYPPMLKRHGLYFSQAIIWDKRHPVLTRKDFMGQHEWCFYGWREGAAHKFFGPNNVTDIWTVKKIPPQQMIHLTEKPVELAARAISYSSLKGENVLDLFGGSGSTLIGAHQLGRSAFLMEIDPLYCDLIVSRFESFTGIKAKLIRRLEVNDG